MAKYFKRTMHLNVKCFTFIINGRYLFLILTTMGWCLCVLFEMSLESEYIFNKKNKAEKKKCKQETDAPTIIYHINATFASHTKTNKHTYTCEEQRN